jgi:hypothetical protein
VKRTDAAEMERREIILRGLIVLAALPVLNSCRTGSGTLPRKIAAETLVEKYSVSVEAARREFDGKELVVTGYVSKGVAIPEGDESEGLILLGHEHKPIAQVQCWFSRYESPEFADVGTGQLVTVKGVFNGESGIVLKFCKLVEKGQ